MSTESLRAQSTLPRPGTASTSLVGSTVGKKFLMAVTGFLAFGFVAGHLVGNLLIFLGPDAINAYGEKLRNLGPLLWVLRIGLLVTFGAHIMLGIQLKSLNSAARPIEYGKKNTIQASLASRYMWLSGLVVLAFVIYHLAHFTFQVTHPQFSNLTDAQGRHDIHSMVILGFSQWYLSAFYLLGVGLLSWHVSHGVASMFQSLGLMQQSWRVPLGRLATLFGLLLFVGYASIPISVMLGILKFAEGGN